MSWQTSGQILVQGLDGISVIDSIAKMQSRGTSIVAGISPSHETEVIKGIPIFALVEEAIAALGEMQTSLIFVHPYGVLDAACEAIASGIKQLIIFSKEVPPLDMVNLLRLARENNTLILGPASAGIIIPEQLCLGIGEPQFYTPGKIAILTDSLNLSYEVASTLKTADMGESIITSIGTEPILGTDFAFWLEFLNNHQPTEAIALISQWERINLNLVNYIKDSLQKPIVIYAYNLKRKGRTYVSNILNIVSNQLAYGSGIQSSESTVKDLLKELNISLANTPTQVKQALNHVSH